jgi:hypothetical protein
MWWCGTPGYGAPTKCPPDVDDEADDNGDEAEDPSRREHPRPHPVAHGVWPPPVAEVPRHSTPMPIMSSTSASPKRILYTARLGTGINNSSPLAIVIKKRHNLIS